MRLCIHIIIYIYLFYRKCFIIKIIYGFNFFLIFWIKRCDFMSIAISSLALSHAIDVLYESKGAPTRNSCHELLHYRVPWLHSLYLSLPFSLSTTRAKSQHAYRVSVTKVSTNALNWSRSRRVTHLRSSLTRSFMQSLWGIVRLHNVNNSAEISCTLYTYLVICNMSYILEVEFQESRQNIHTYKIYK